METSRNHTTISTLILVACGIWLVGLGIYFVALRPGLLPEDPRFIGTGLTEIRTAIPGLERWLRHVFTVMGGFMIASSLLTIWFPLVAERARHRATTIILATAGLLTVGTMSLTNFLIDSDFKWLLLAPALLWLVGVFFRLGESGTAT